jgi:DNA-binding transcriptional LysR family regulator
MHNRTVDSKDLQIFLAVARQGSTLAASKQLKVSQSTVSRRIEVLEGALELELFDKKPSGYVLTDSGRALIPHAEAVEAALQAVESAATEHKRGSAAPIRFTTLEAFGQTFMVPALREFRTAYPDIHIEAIATEDVLDLAAGDADVAVRAGPRPDSAGLVTRRIARDGWGIYCARSYADEHGIPKTPDELADHAVIALSEGFRRAPLALWFDEVVPESAIVVRQHSIPGLLAGLRSGAGVAPMSDLVASTDETLVRCFTPPVEVQIDIWLVTRERLRHEPRVRALMDFFAGYFANARYQAARS